jgi:hypothetical protein
LVLAVQLIQQVHQILRLKVAILYFPQLLLMVVVTEQEIDHLPAVDQVAVEMVLVIQLPVQVQLIRVAMAVLAEIIAPVVHVVVAVAVEQISPAVVLLQTMVDQVAMA